MFAALHALGTRCHSWRTLFQRTAGLREASLAQVPWIASYDCRLPSAASPAQIETACDGFSAALERANARLIALRGRVVFPHRFNRGVATHGNKSSLLSQTTVRLVRWLLRQFPPGEVVVLSDKHGGRNHYLPLLQTAFPEHLVRIESESRLQSTYHFSPRPGQTVRWTFRQGAEAALPAALASMLAKYLREQGMAAFNAFWSGHVPSVKPTAGYPLDAHRFRGDIAQKQQELGIDDHHLWRCC